MATANPTELARRIADALIKTLQVVECDDVAGLRKAGAAGPALLANRPVRVARYYDIHPAITIYDGRLGTLAFVDVIERTELATKRAIERATAIRQILLDEAERSRQSLALQVEVVLVIDDSAASAGDDPLKAALAYVARQTAYLRLVGVSVLDLARHPTLDEPVLRRAFPWLLRGADAWFSSEAFNTVGGADEWRPAAAAFELQLRDYRNPGTRRFACNGDTWLNLVHGQNGSGKSSLSESIELLLTNRVQRLDEAREPNYFRAVRYRPGRCTDTELAQLSAAEVAVHSPVGALRSSVRVEYDKPLIRAGATPAPDRPAYSFRIDQVFMDRLTRSSPGDRAALFLHAFSPQDQHLLTQLQQLRHDVRAAWDALPEPLRQQAELSRAGQQIPHAAEGQSATTLTEDEMADVIVRELGALLPDGGAAATPRLLARALERLLPGTRQQMTQATRLLPATAAPLKALCDVADDRTAMDRSAMLEAMAQIQAALASIQTSLGGHLDDVTRALRVLHEVNTWTAGTRIVGGDFETDVRRWLDLQAQVDLTSKYADVVATVERARARQWEPDPRDAALLRLDGLPPGLGEALAARRRELVDGLHEARARVESRQEITDRAGDGAAPVTEPLRRWLPQGEVEALNRVGARLAAIVGPEPLGERFNRALSTDREEQLADGTIGKRGGLDAAIAEATELRHVCSMLQAIGPRLGQEMLSAAEAAVRVANQLVTLNTRLPQTFFHRLTTDAKDLSRLVTAFNELLALVTPARWVYRDIHLRPAVAGGNPSLGFHTDDGAPADLLFNTAELNASALVLFLLLAPRLRNELCLLVLDDPLQNMDELTVIALGRALAKLGVLYPRAWTVLAFFHGEENVERIRQEAPSQVYHLPWVSSSSTGTDTPIIARADLSTAQATWQTLSEDLLMDTAPAPAGTQ